MCGKAWGAQSQFFVRYCVQSPGEWSPQSRTLRVLRLVLVSLQVMRDYQTPAVITMFNQIALPTLIIFVAPYFAYLLDMYPAMRGLVFVLNLLWIETTTLLLAVQVCSIPQQF